MTDPVTISASAIATLAFKKLIETGAGELAKKFTAAAIEKMDMLRIHIWTKLSGKPRIDEAKTAIEQTNGVTADQVDQITAYLQVAMDEDAKFADEIRQLAHEINAGKLLDQHNMTMNIHDQGRGWQTKVEGGTAYIGDIHINRKSD